ncbi:5' nucleotidase, NT5C type [Butyrivibrio sp. AE2032]|uniref:5' nucleotidase, NT5C type n=1 Tax=Butyrivibrio sp. AE2032 TaxID=1458463 RepID=UPI0005549994|nr:2-dehydropantoate 2-reductase [Butyrivibrio sp. AE2032]
MKIYVDFDDCLCETAKSFSRLVEDMYGKRVPYENMKYFSLQKTFELTDDQYDEMMIAGHQPEVLLSYDETPGASETINAWLDAGHDVRIITGRPSLTYDASRGWLDQHGLERVDLYCLNKYGRDHFFKNSEFTIELEDYYKMHFDVAVEDSPSAFKFFDHLPELKVLVFDRPWNKSCEFPSDNYVRCTDWEMIRGIVG